MAEPLEGEKHGERKNRKLAERRQTDEKVVEVVVGPASPALLSPLVS